MKMEHEYYMDKETGELFTYEEMLDEVKKMHENIPTNALDIDKLFELVMFDELYDDAESDVNDFADRISNSYEELVSEYVRDVFMKNEFTIKQMSSAIELSEIEEMYLFHRDGLIHEVKRQLAELEIATRIGTSDRDLWDKECNEISKLRARLKELIIDKWSLYRAFVNEHVEGIISERDLNSK